MAGMNVVVTPCDDNGNIDITPNGTGKVNISKVDINSGFIDNTIIGSSRDCDSSNYTDSDTNNEAALNLGGGLTAYATIALTEAAAGSDEAAILPCCNTAHHGGAAEATAGAG